MENKDLAPLKDTAHALSDQQRATSTRGRAIRTIAPAIPLAIALLHGAIAPKGNAPTPTTPTTTTATAFAGKVSCKGDYCAVPTPLLTKGHSVSWWFVFKLNANKFPQCDGGDTRACPFGGTVQVTNSYKNFGQQFVYASSDTPALKDGGKECLGTTTEDPVGATFDEIYNGRFHYVVWNDQPYGDPSGVCSGDSCSAPWAHSKGVVAWNDVGDGIVMQVSTPSWPLAASAKHPRLTDGNTLGCVRDNDVKVSQHFFALKLSKTDLVTVLEAMSNAGVVTDPKNLQVVDNGGPSDVQQLVSGMGVISQSRTVVTGMLSGGTEIISKPPKLFVPPWQMVSSELGGVSLRVANWWIDPNTIPSTKADTPINCWDSTLNTKPGAVDIATSGHWNNIEFSLKGGLNTNANHGKFGVSTSGSKSYVIFGDMNQEGSIGEGVQCSASQNGRGGMFFVMKNADLAKSVTALLAGESAPLPN